MTRYVNCPVCNTRLKSDYYYEECFGLCEEYILCPKCLMTLEKSLCRRSI